MASNRLKVFRKFLQQSLLRIRFRRCTLARMDDALHGALHTQLRHGIDWNTLQYPELGASKGKTHAIPKYQDDRILHRIHHHCMEPPQMRSVFMFA